MNLLAVGFCAFLSVLVHGRAIGAFFSPDDLVHLEQAAGILPTLPTPFRVLSQVLYFRVMFSIFGAAPLPFHVVTCLLHLVNIALVFAVAGAFGARRLTAAVYAGLFGTFPLFFVLLSSAVGVNDELALAFTLTAILALRRDGWIGTILPGLLFTLGFLCKESVLFLSLLPLIHHRRLGVSRRRVLPLLLVTAIAATWFVLLRPGGLLSSGAAYAVKFGPNVFHNLVTYTSWSVDLMNAIPDLATAYSTIAWPLALPVLLSCLLGAAFLGQREPTIRIGLSWFALGLLPVLPLELQTYRHYLYPALPGFMMALAGTVLTLLEVALRSARGSGRTAGNADRSRMLAAVAAVLLVAYAARAGSLVRQRTLARVPGTELALDPDNRRREVAAAAIHSLATQLTPASRHVAILTPEGVGRVFGARSGRQYRNVSRTRTYSLLEESMDGGRAVRLFCPWVDSVAFISRWTPRYRDFHVFLPLENGRLLGVGSGPAAHSEAARWMLERRWYPQARDYLREVVEAHPDEPMLQLAYGTALFRAGDSTASMSVLKGIVRVWPKDSVASAARNILEAFGRRR